MKTAELEAEVKSLTETVARQEARVTRAEDIEAIKKLQYAYGYYLEHWQEEELSGLFSHNPEVAVEINDFGLFKGWKGVENALSSKATTPISTVKRPPAEYLHILMPISGIVNLYPDGKTPKADCTVTSWVHSAAKETCAR